MGRRGSEITTQYGNWGRNGLMAVATRHLGWRLVDSAPAGPAEGGVQKCFGEPIVKSTDLTPLPPPRLPTEGWGK